MNSTKDITGFHVGLISNPDHKDIPDDAASACSNLDPDGEGVLRGIKAALSKSTTAGIKSMTIGKFIKTIGGNYDLVCTDGTNIYTLGDFYGTPGLVTMYLTDNSTGTSEAMVPTTMVVKNEELHIGRGTASVPKWIGRTNYNLFGVNTYNGAMCIEDAECPQQNHTGTGYFYVVSAVEHGGTSAFDPTLQYRYTISCILDGLQETPLSSYNYTAPETITADADYITVVIGCNYAVTDPSYVNKRITGIRVYRREEAQSPTGTGKMDGIYKPTSAYRLVKEIDTTASTGWANSGATKIYTFNDANDYLGASYEDNTGIAETSTSSIVNYGISTEMNNFLFVGNCAKTGLPDAGHMLFRSKAYRYDMFDWVNDYLKLPTVPTALAGYRGRVYAFDLNNMYVINPENFSIEDTLEGMGCTSHKSWVATDFGLFWASKNNIYWHDGTKIEPIGERIKTEWQTAAASTTPVVTFNAEKSLVMFHLGNNAYSWHVFKKRFDYYTTLITGFLGAVTGKDGEEYISNGTNLEETFGGTTDRAWSWTSKEFDMDDSNQVKEWYHLRQDYTGSTTPLYSVAGGTPATALTDSTKIQSGGAWVKSKTLKIKISGNAGVAGFNTCESAQIIFRRMRGAR